VSDKPPYPITTVNRVDIMNVPATEFFALLERAQNAESILGDAEHARDEALQEVARLRKDLTTVRKQAAHWAREANNLADRTEYIETLRRERDEALQEVARLREKLKRIDAECLNSKTSEYDRLTVVAGICDERVAIDQDPTPGSEEG